MKDQDKRPIEEKALQQEPAQQAQEVQPEPLPQDFNNLEKMEAMTEEERQAAIAALTPGQLKTYKEFLRRQSDLAQNIGNSLIDNFKEAHAFNFDTAAVAKAMNAMNFAEGITQNVVKSLTEAVNAAVEASNELSKHLAGIIENISRQAAEILELWWERAAQADKEIADFLTTKTWGEIQKIFPDTAQWIQAAREENPVYTAEIIPAFRFMLPELRQYAADHGTETEAATLAGLISIDEIETAQPRENSPFIACIELTAARLGTTAAGEEIAEIVQNFKAAQAQDAIQINRHIEKSDFPIDKVNSHIWSLLETDAKAQLKFDVGKKGRPPIDIIYTIDFDEIPDNLHISKKLEEYDKRVYIAVSSLYAYLSDTSPSDIMTIGQIYNAMGYDGVPGAADKKKINNALSKMTGARIYLDNMQEYKAYKNNKTGEHGYIRYKYDGSLLPLERITKDINGQILDGVIHLLRIPPMYEFAKGRKQITTINRNVLQSPLNKTNENLRIENYFIESISKMRNGNRPHKMLYTTIFKRAEIKTPKQQQRAKEKIKKLLDHYEQIGFISEYEISKDGVNIHT